MTHGISWIWTTRFKFRPVRIARSCCRSISWCLSWPRWTCPNCIQTHCFCMCLKIRPKHTKTMSENIGIKMNQTHPMIIYEEHMWPKSSNICVLLHLSADRLESKTFHLRLLSPQLQGLLRTLEMVSFLVHQMPSALRPQFGWCIHTFIQYMIYVYSSHFLFLTDDVGKPQLLEELEPHLRLWRIRPQHVRVSVAGNLRWP